MSETRLRMIGTAIASIVLLVFAVCAMRSYQACEVKHGTLVRGTFWFACVQEAR